MTTPAEEPKKVCEETAEGQQDLAALLWIKWDVAGGRDRTMPNVPIGTNHVLDGQPRIQGIEIKNVRVTLRCWADSQPNGLPNITVDGPTNGKVPVGPTRVGSYRCDRRD